MRAANSRGFGDVLQESFLKNNNLNRKKDHYSYFLLFLFLLSEITETTEMTQKYW